MIRVRPATVDDNEEICETIVTCWRQTYKHIFRSEFLAQLDVRPEGRNKFIIDNNIYSFVVCIKDKIVGFCDIGLAKPVADVTIVDGSYGEIYAIYVLNDFQKQGIGKALFNTACAHLKNSGFKHLIIWALKDNIEAQKFYLKLGGIERNDWHKNFVVDGQEYPEKAYCYRLND